MEEQLYWVWLSLAFGPCSAKVHEILQRYPNPRDLYEAVQRLERPLSPLSEKEYATVRATTLEKAQSVLNDCEKKHIGIVNIREQWYPQKLLHIYAPPVLLYTLGRYPPFNEKLIITMVGSRDVTRTGYEVGRSIARDLALMDVIVVSGMALGGDSSAHIGALEAGGYTVAVMACGCDIDYPAQNRDLHVQVARNGCILTEYPPGVRPEPNNFRMRNRILSGLSNGVIVTECRQKSGALMTATYALEQGRDVFAVPNSAADEYHGGTFGLLRDGAIPVRKASDVMEYYANLQGVPLHPQPAPWKENVAVPPKAAKSKKTTRKLEQEAAPRASETEPAFPQSMPAPPPSPPPVPKVPTLREMNPDVPLDILSRVESLRPSAVPDPPPYATEEDPELVERITALEQDAHTVYAALTAEARSADALIAATGLETHKVMAALIELECSGLCDALPGQRYRLPK